MGFLTPKQLLELFLLVSVAFSPRIPGGFPCFLQWRSVPSRAHSVPCDVRPITFQLSAGFHSLKCALPHKNNRARKQSALFSSKPKTGTHLFGLWCP